MTLIFGDPGPPEKGFTDDHSEQDARRRAARFFDCEPDALARRDDDAGHFYLRPASTERQRQERLL